MQQIKYYLLACILAAGAAFQGAFGQGQQAADSLKVQAKKVKKETMKAYSQAEWFYWGLRAGGGQMGWSHDNDQVTVDPGTVISGGLFFNFRPLKWTEVEVGVDVMKLTTKASMEAYSATVNTTDDEGDKYEQRLAVKNVTEEQELLLLNVPVALKLYASPGNWELFVKGGVEYRHALKAEYDQRGQFSRQGYYPQWDLLIDELPDRGYYTNRRLDSGGDLTWKAVFDPFVGAGVVFPGLKSNFFIEGRYYLGGSDPVDEKVVRPFAGPEGNGSVINYNNESLLQTGKVSLNGFLVNIGLRF